MIQPIETYHVVRFLSQDDFLSFEARMLDFLSSPDGLAFMTDPNRAVIWGPPLFLHSQEQILHCSPGVLAAAEQLGIAPSSSETIERSALSPDRTLIVGDASDWH
ncbi:MAG: hypothetical protein ACYSWU_17020 [Planctomycetota bacterium]|jgi:hypothetical protein